jgi:hypothetical protein
VADLDLTDTIVRADRALFSRGAVSGNGAAAARPAPDTAPGARYATDDILRFGFLVAAVGIAVQTVLHLVGYLALDGDYAFLSLDSDDGLFAWVTGALALVGAMSCVVLGLTTSRPRAYFGLAAVLALFSLDDVLAIHERVGHEHFGLGPDINIGRVVWPAVYSPILVVAAVLIWTVARRAPLPVGAVIRAGLVGLAAGLALEIASVVLFQFSWGPLSRPYEAEVMLEEGFELAGLTLVVTGLAALAYTNLAKLGERTRAPE